MRAEWSLVVLALGLHFVQALVQPDLNHNILKELLTCVATLHATTIQRDNRRPHMAWCNFMNPGTSGSCPFGPTIPVNSNHIAQRGWNENVWLENKQQPPPPFDNALWRIPQVQYYIQRHDEKSWPALLRNTELMVRLQITDWIYECIKKQNKIKKARSDCLRRAASKRLNELNTPLASFATVHWSRASHASLLQSYEHRGRQSNSRAWMHTGPPYAATAYGHDRADR